MGRGEVREDRGEKLGAQCLVAGKVRDPGTEGAKARSQLVSDSLDILGKENYL